MIQTARDYCINALYDCGEVAEGLDASPEQISRALRELNGLFRRWNAEGLTRYAMESRQIMTNAPIITIGATGDIVVSSRPKNIVSVVCNGTELRQVSISDMLATSATIGTPVAFAYNAKDPNGEIFIYPTPSSTMAFAISFENLFGSFGLNDDISVPDEYYDLLRWSLADRLSKSFGIPRMDLQAEAERALRVVKSMNINMREMDVDRNLLRCRRW